MSKTYFPEPRERSVPAALAQANRFERIEAPTPFTLADAAATLHDFSGVPDELELRCTLFGATVTLQRIDGSDDKTVDLVAGETLKLEGNTWRRVRAANFTPGSNARVRVIGRFARPAGVAVTAPLPEVAAPPATT